MLKPEKACQKFEDNAVYWIVALLILGVSTIVVLAGIFLYRWHIYILRR